MWNCPFYKMSTLDFHVYCTSHIPLAIHVPRKRDLRVPKLIPRPRKSCLPRRNHCFVTDKKKYLACGNGILKRNKKCSFMDFRWPKKDTFMAKRKVMDNWFESRRYELLNQKKPVYKYVPKVPTIWDNNHYASFVFCQQEWEQYKERFKVDVTENNPLAKGRHVSFEMYDMTPLTQYRKQEQRQDMWWIVPDSIVVMTDSNFLRSLVKSDPSLRIRIPYELLHDMDGLKKHFKERQVVKAVLDFLDTEAGHYKYISAQGCVQNEDLIEDNPYCTDSIINCCLQLTTKHYYVVLLSEDKDTTRRAKASNIPVFTRVQAKDLITRKNGSLPLHKLSVQIDVPKQYTRQFAHEIDVGGISPIPKSDDKRIVSLFNAPPPPPIFDYHPVLDFHTLEWVHFFTRYPYNTPYLQPLIPMGNNPNTGLATPLVVPQAPQSTAPVVNEETTATYTPHSPPNSPTDGYRPLTPPSPIFSPHSPQSHTDTPAVSFKSPQSPLTSSNDYDPFTF